VRLAWPKRPKIVCSPSYVDIRSRANTTRGLDFERMIKALAHKGGVRIGKTPKKIKIKKKKKRLFSKNKILNICRSTFTSASVSSAGVIGRMTGESL
jgi:hypothetical protein